MFFSLNEHADLLIKNYWNIELRYPSYNHNKLRFLINSNCIIFLQIEKLSKRSQCSHSIQPGQGETNFTLISIKCLSIVRTYYINGFIIYSCQFSRFPTTVHYVKYLCECFNKSFSFCKHLLMTREYFHLKPIKSVLSI